jgi:hypothetical protein
MDVNETGCEHQSIRVLPVLLLFGMHTRIYTYILTVPPQRKNVYIVYMHANVVTFSNPALSST